MTENKKDFVVDVAVVAPGVITVVWFAAKACAQAIIGYVAAHYFSKWWEKRKAKDVQRSDVGVSEEKSE